MQFAANYQNNYMAYPVNREQDGYAMNGYAPPPPGTPYHASLARISEMLYTNHHHHSL